MKTRTIYTTDDGAEFTDYHAALAREQEINPPVERTKRAHLLTVLVIDHDDLGADDVKATIENARYPNHCISPQCKAVQTIDIGVWSDDHPLNLSATDDLAWLRERAVEFEIAKEGTPP